MEQKTKWFTPAFLSKVVFLLIALHMINFLTIMLAEVFRETQFTKCANAKEIESPQYLSVLQTQSS